MKLTKLYIISLLACALSFFSCTDDDDVQEQQLVEYCVQTAWTNGRGGGETRTLTSFLADVSKGELALAPAEYPEEIALRCNEKDITLTRNAALESCTNHSGFYHGYTSDYPLKDIEAKKGVTASAKLDDIDELYSDENDIVVDGVHLKITMHHSKALLRFGFKVSEKYDKVRYIVVKGVKINGDDCTTVPKVINTTTLRAVSYMYISPSAVDANITSTPMQIECTYDIYEKDAVFTNNVVTDDDITKNADHLTRKDVVAKNTFTLNNIKDADKNLVTQLKAGYYYDLRITLNPDYLYVLSEHDNKHITIE